MKEKYTIEQDDFVGYWHPVGRTATADTRKGEGDDEIR